jgi:hypothetical protein
MSTNLDLHAYRVMVLDAMEQATKTGKPVVFGNTGPAHAAVVLEVMLANATKTIDIVSGFLHASVWLVPAIDKLLSRGKDIQIRILLDELTDSTIPEGSALSQVAPSKRISAKRLSAPLGVHLCLVDSKHIRLEALQRTHEASVTFGDDRFGLIVARTFNSLWKQLSDVPLLSCKRELCPA